MDLSAFVGKLLAEEDGDVLREGVRVLAQALMEAEVTELVGAERHERNDERTGYRNGSRPRVWDTRVGTIELAVPKVRPGSHRRGLRGLRLVISDAHEGLKQAVGTVLSGASWQRCRVHFMRNLLALVPHPAREAVAAVVRTIFAYQIMPVPWRSLEKVVDGLRPRFAQAATLLADAAEDLLAHKHFPAEHRTRLHSTNPLERLNKEIKELRQRPRHQR